MRRASASVACQTYTASASLMVDNDPWWLLCRVSKDLYNII